VPLWPTAGIQHESGGGEPAASGAVQRGALWPPHPRPHVSRWPPATATLPESRPSCPREPAPGAAGCLATAAAALARTSSEGELEEGESRRREAGKRPRREEVGASVCSWASSRSSTRNCENSRSSRPPAWTSRCNNHRCRPSSPNSTKVSSRRRKARHQGVGRRQGILHACCWVVVSQGSWLARYPRSKVS
jgi:hypothetical protein